MLTVLKGEDQVMASSEMIKSAIDTYLGAIAAMDADAFANAFAPDGVSNDPVGTPPHEGREAIREFLQGILAACERLSLTPDHIFVAGDNAALKWTGQLTSKGGQSVTFEGIDVVQVNDDGKIQTLHAYWDPAPVMAVLRAGSEASAASA
jgi:steroid delta-isomerase